MVGFLFVRWLDAVTAAAAAAIADTKRRRKFRPMQYHFGWGPSFCLLVWRTIFVQTL